MALCATQSNCGFPDYSFPEAASGAGGSPLGGSGGAVTPEGGGGNSAGGGAAGDAGAAGAGGEPGVAGAAGSACVYLKPVTYPMNCFDKALSTGESGIDCGGTCLPCDGTQTCATNSDCASGTCTAGKTCSPVLSLQYKSIVSDQLTPTPKFELWITYLDSKPVMLSDLSIRYYFNHNTVDEPVIPLDTQGTLDLGDSQLDIGMSSHWTIHRFPLGPADQNSRKTDSYLEITFTDSVTLSAGATLDLTQDIVAGSNDVKFDQSSHYSFVKAPTTAIANEAITVYRVGMDAALHRVWGVDPPMNLLPDCAYTKGVNVGGDMVTVGGRLLEASSGQMQFAGTPFFSTTPLTPAADTATTKMLATGFPLSASLGATWTVPQSGAYWVYAWLTSASSANAGTLALQDNPAIRFIGKQNMSTGYWSLTGPYAVTIAEDRALRLTSVGSVYVAGLMLYRMQP